MTSPLPSAWLPCLVGLGALSACADEDAATPAPQDLSEPLAAVATQNAGTTRLLDMRVVSELRPICTDAYDNNLCTLDSEALLAALIDAERPDVLFLQEMWDQRRCGEEARAAEVDAAPFACGAGGGSQTARVLPDGYRWACAEGYPDNCIAFRPAVFVPVGADGVAADCPDGDCSAAMRSVGSECARIGRIAWLPGATTEGPATLVVVHTNAGPFDGDKACRGLQLEALGDALAAEVELGELIMAGDFNFDPQTAEGPDVEALAALMERFGLVRLPDDGPTHRILNGDLDLVLTDVGGWGDGRTCSVTFADEGAAVPMFDHAFVSCR